MPALKWLDAYSGQSAEQLFALEVEYRIDSLVVAFEQAVDQKAFREGQGSLSDEERIILAVEALEREVNNGGYSQFFVNSSREYVPIIVDALMRIDCPRTAAITDEAIQVLQIPNLTAETIDAAMRESNDIRDQQLNRIDAQYFAEAEPIANQLFDFIKTNRAAIRL
jgi:hypothetical protein